MFGLSENSSWYKLFEHYKLIDGLRILENRYKIESINKTIYPEQNEVLNAFNFCDFRDVRVVILGQDPYHGAKQAHGLAFSVNRGVALPPSLKNIFKEINRDLGINYGLNGDLSSWAKQGVFLLNTILTVEASKPLSHISWGWETFTKICIEKLDKHNSGIVFMLWGGSAKKLKINLKNPNNLILESSHPSPLSVYRGFDGCSHFSLCNDFLIKTNRSPIDWSLPNN
jgi:uracil-DNA glycosylase